MEEEDLKALFDWNLSILFGLFFRYIYIYIHI